MTTILDTLRNADFNLRTKGIVGVIIAKPQIHNATVLLEKGYPLTQDVEDLLDEYGSVSHVPEVEN